MIKTFFVLIILGIQQAKRVSSLNYGYPVTLMKIADVIFPHEFNFLRT